jgi:hypothetical protein
LRWSDHSRIYQSSVSCVAISPGTIVFRAQDTWLERDMTVKILLEDFVSDAMAESHEEAQFHDLSLFRKGVGSSY